MTDKSDSAVNAVSDTQRIEALERTVAEVLSNANPGTPSNPRGGTTRTGDHQSGQNTLLQYLPPTAAVSTTYQERLQQLEPLVGVNSKGADGNDNRTGAAKTTVSNISGHSTASSSSFEESYSSPADLAPLLSESLVPASAPPSLLRTLISQLRLALRQQVQLSLLPSVHSV